MGLSRASSFQNSHAVLTDKSLYQTQFEFMSVGERLSRINERIKKFSTNNPSKAREQLERCMMLRFVIDDTRVTQARQLIISLCKDRLIFLRVKPHEISTSTYLEIFVKSSIAHQVKDLMELRFNCWNDSAQM